MGSVLHIAWLQMAQPAGVTSGMTLATTEAGHMAGKAKLIPTGGPVEDYGQLKYRESSAPGLDGNTVDLDSERVQFADNTLHLESGMTLVSSQIKGIAVGDHLGQLTGQLTEHNGSTSHGSTQLQPLRDQRRRLKGHKWEGSHVIMMNILDVAGSALTAESQRLNVTRRISRMRKAWPAPTASPTAPSRSCSR